MRLSLASLVVVLSAACTSPTVEDDAGLDASVVDAATVDTNVDAACPRGVFTRDSPEIPCYSFYCDFGTGCCSDPRMTCGAAHCVAPSESGECPYVTFCTGRVDQCPPGEACCTVSGDSGSRTECRPFGSTCDSWRCVTDDACPPEAPFCQHSPEGDSRCRAP